MTSKGNHRRSMGFGGLTLKRNVEEVIPSLLVSFYQVHVSITRTGPPNHNFGVNLFSILSHLSGGGLIV